MTTYYVRRDGSDAANGLSDANAWQTIAKVNGFGFSSGDIIQFKSGHLWREMLIVPAANLTFQTYGGVLPGTFLASKAASLSTDWTSEPTNLWYTSANPTPNIVWQYDSSNGNPWVAMTQVSAKVDVTDPTKWWWDSGNNRVYTFGTANPTISGVRYEIGQRDSGIYLTAKNFTTTRNLKVRFANQYGIWFNGGATDGTVRSCDTKYTYYSGIYFNGAKNARVERSKISYCGKSASVATLDHAGIAMTLGAGDSANAYIGHNDISHTGRTGITIYDRGMNGTVIEGNEVAYTAENENDTTAPGPNRLGYGIQLYNSDFSNPVTAVKVRSNYVHDTPMAGIAMLNAWDGLEVSRNRLVRNLNDGTIYQQDYSTNILFDGNCTNTDITRNFCYQPTEFYGLDVTNIGTNVGLSLGATCRIQHNVFYNGCTNGFFNRTVSLRAGNSPILDGNFHLQGTPGNSGYVFAYNGPEYTWIGRPLGVEQSWPTRWSGAGQTDWIPDSYCGKSAGAAALEYLALTLPPNP